MLHAAEELLVLVLSDEMGTLDPAPGLRLDCALAGAVLMELALADRIDTDLDRLILLDDTPLGDDLLDPYLAAIAQEPESRDTNHWVGRIAESADDIRDIALANLVDRGIVQIDEGGFSSLSRWVSRARRYPTVEGEAEREVTVRIMGILFSDDIPSPRDIIVINLAHSSGMLGRLLSASEYEQVAERIALICRLNLIGRAVAGTIQELEDAARDLDRDSKEDWPRTSGLPIAGYYFGLSGNVVAWFVKQYRKHGPVFEINVPGLSYIVLAGVEANQLAHRHGSQYFRSYDFYSGFRDELRTGTFLAALDGEEHRRLRRVLRDGYSKGQVEKNIPEAVAAVRDEAARWPHDRPMSAFAALQRVTAEFIGKVAANTSPGESITDFTVIFNAILTTRVLHNRPPFFMRLPRVKRAYRRMEAFCAEVMADHAPERRGEARSDVIDALMELNRADPRFMAESDMTASVMGPFVAGLDTAGATVAFALYALLKDPELLDRARREADEALGEGDLSGMRILQMETLLGVVMESLRMYPIAIGMRRLVVNSFDYAGYRIPAGSDVLVAHAVTHYLPEFFPDPEVFDVDRYKEPRREHAQPGAWTPFGLGSHTCLGSGFAQAQIVLTLAVLLHDYDIRLARPGYTLKIDHVPASRPSKGFRIRVRPRSVAA